MAAEWYYTTNKQQMGPVSWLDLRELAETGILKPHDLVWTEGMDEWVKAIQQTGLFQETAVGRKAASKPPAGRRVKRQEDDEVEDDEDDEEDDRRSRKKKRKREVERTKMATGLKVGLILGGVVCGLLFLGCAGGAMIWLAVRGGGGGGGPGNQSYTVNNLQQMRFEDRTFTFQQGRRVIITVTNNTQFPNTDVDVLVLRGAGQNMNNIVALDERVPMLDRNCRIDFIVPATDTYRVRLKNLGPGRANSCFVNITIQ